jgi:hypothetical protein
MSNEEIVTLPAPQVDLTPKPRTKWEREYQAFRHLLPELLRTHRGKYVAIHEGQVVDSDTDDIALIQRVHAKYGYVPIHVEQVAEQPTVVRMPHYRIFRAGDSA